VRVPTNNADIFTLARFGDMESFKEKFVKEHINQKNEHGSGLLHYAISGKKFDIALFLLNNGIDVNMINSDSQTALHLICVNQQLDVVEKLLENNADINLRDKYGNNAVWTAVFNCKGKNYDMVRLLMKYNPDIHTKNKAGRSPLDFAKQIQDYSLLEILDEE
jgi:ankyrin repeat protein